MKMDFQQERHLKKRMFGREFENHDCLSLTKNNLRCITLDQTFSNDFMFVGLNLKYILCSQMHNESRRLLNQVVLLCKLAKIRHVMMAFINSEILPKDCFWMMMSYMNV